MPDRQPAMAQVVGRVVRDLRVPERAGHRLSSGRDMETLEHTTLRYSILQRPGRLERVHELLRQVDPHLNWFVFVADFGSRRRRPAASTSAHRSAAASPMRSPPCSTVMKNSRQRGRTLSRIATKCSSEGGFASSVTRLGSFTFGSRAGLRSIPMTAAERVRFTRWWLEESGLSRRELREIAVWL